MLLKTVGLTSPNLATYQCSNEPSASQEFLDTLVAPLDRQDIMPAIVAG